MPSPILMRRVGGGAFSPSSIPGLTLWVAADRIQGLADGGSVTSWSDLSGNGNNLVPGTAPTYKVGIQNGKPVVRFNGTTQYLDSPAFTLNHPCTVCMAVSATTNGGDESDGLTQNTRIIQRTTDTSSILYSGTSRTFVVTSLAVFNSMLMTFNGANTFISQNGADTAVQNVGSAAGSGIRFGAAGGAATAFCAMDLGEAICYSRALSPGERDKIRSYFKARWGTP